MLSRTKAVSVTILLLFELFAGAEELVRPFHQVAHSLVLILVIKNEQIVNAGSGFVIDSSSTGSIILTAAHVLLTPGQRGPAREVYVYRTYSPTPIAERITVQAADIDQALDLALIRVSTPNLPVTCLSYNLPAAGSRIGLAAFSIRQIGNKPPKITKGKLNLLTDETFPTVREGTLGLLSRTGAEYFAPIDVGFSGGPLFSETTGLAFAVVQSVAELSGPLGFRPASATFFSHSGGDFVDFITRRLGNRFNFVHASEGTTFAYPSMARLGRLMIINSISDGSTKNTASLAVLDYTLREAAKLYLGLLQTDLIEQDDSELAHSLEGIADSKERARIRYRFFQKLCNTYQTVGSIAVKRQFSRDGENLIYELSFVDCWGDTYATVKTGEIAVPSDSTRLGSPGDEWLNVRTVIGQSLKSAGTNMTSLVNFRSYGILLADGQRRAFLSLTRAEDGRILLGDLFPSGTAQLRNLKAGEEVMSFDGVSESELKKMSDKDLASLVSAAENKPLGFEVNGGWIDGLNICGYLANENIGTRDYRIAVGIP